MDAQFKDFREVHQRYLSALKYINARNVGAAEKIEESIAKMTHSDLLYSGMLGIKANLDNFINPVTGNFLSADYSDILRENIAHRLPEYCEGQELFDQIFHRSDIEKEAILNDIIEYVSYLETVGPKLAHYMGYMLGNKLLYMTVPGYCPDNVLTIQYTSMIQKIMGSVIL